MGWREILIFVWLGLLAPFVLYGQSSSSTNAISSAGRSSAAFDRAQGRRAWAFPRDHGQHPRYRLEWWYYTGIVRTKEGRPFGFQITFFRQGLSQTLTTRASAWRTNSLYLAHLAISDLQTGQFHYASLTGRDGLALSGASDDQMAVWLGAWKIEPIGRDQHKIRIEAQDKTLGISVELVWDGEPVLHGRDGLDQKGESPGEASWYYSLPRMRTIGYLRIHGEHFAIGGTTWMDHEFGTTQLGPTQVGWDWMSIRLNTGHDLMVYRLRNRDGTSSATSGGTLVLPSGEALRLGLEGSVGLPIAAGSKRVRAISGNTWESPKSGARYPLQWSVAVPDVGLDLKVEPASEGQELLPGGGLSFGYWEGVIWAKGHLGGREVQGEGYLELTGYSGDLSESFR